MAPTIDLKEKLEKLSECCTGMANDINDLLDSWDGEPGANLVLIQKLLNDHQAVKSDYILLRVNAVQQMRQIGGESE